ncbi:MAG: hypothetical protein MJ239_05165 [Bacilli bacterium]|nr:hypothetical protein [Bacilli bacterium]
MKKYILKDNKTGGESPYFTSVELGVENGCLKANFVCHHSSMYSAGNNFNDNLYNGDVVELFIYTGIKDHYFEIELSPNNAHFVGDIENKDRSPKLTLINKDIFASTITKTDLGYDAFISIPLSELGCSKESIRLNAYRIETNGGEPNACLMALNPTMCGSFHVRSEVKTPVE